MSQGIKQNIIKVLHLEDYAIDIVLIAGSLLKNGNDYNIMVVSTEGSSVEQFNNFNPESVYF